jgi:predicted GNAT superfamily acetyltransferase
MMVVAFKDRVQRKNAVLRTRRQSLWSAASSRRFWQATCRRRFANGLLDSAEPLHAALHYRPVGNATKAVTSHRTPNASPRVSDLTDDNMENAE